MNAFVKANTLGAGANGAMTENGAISYATIGTAFLDQFGKAGATSDSDRMWQIGINVMPEAEGLGIGTMLVAAIKNEILDKNRLPFYGTAMSHIASQRVALGAGFVPAWSELYCEAIKH